MMPGCTHWVQILPLARFSGEARCTRARWFFWAQVPRVVLSAGCISDSEERYKARYGVLPKFLVVEGSGVLVRQQMTVAQTQVLEGISQVVQRIDAKAAIRYLTAADLAEWSTADAQRYQGRVENSFRDRINTSAFQDIPLVGPQK
jgi:hypothetical protein